MSAVRDALALQHEVEQFYYSEARLLDNRRFLAWLELLTKDVRYIIPARHVELADAAKQETDDYHPIEYELSRANEPAFREEGYMMLATRAKRALSSLSWSENPPARTRRFVSNVEVEANEEELRIFNNFMLSYSRHGADNYLYTGQRQDVLRRVDGRFRIAARRVILDWNVVTATTLGLFF